MCILFMMIRETERQIVRERLERQSIRRSRRRHDYYEQLHKKRDSIITTFPWKLRAGRECVVYFTKTPKFPGGDITPAASNISQDQRDISLDRGSLLINYTFNRGGITSTEHDKLQDDAKEQMTQDNSSQFSSTISMNPLYLGSEIYAATLKIPEEAHLMSIQIPSSTTRENSVSTEIMHSKYHFHIHDGRGRRPLLHIAHVAVELAPIAKVGGLGDVVTSLAIAVQDEGHRVEVVIPKYDCIDLSQVKQLCKANTFQHCDDNGRSYVDVDVWKGIVEGFINVTFLEPRNGLFWCGCIYGRNDDVSRFHQFNQYAHHYLSFDQPDIIHCHDWSSAPMVWLNSGSSGHFMNYDYDYAKTKTIFTIHNLGYGSDFLQRAVWESNGATTVSPTYAKEILTTATFQAHDLEKRGRTIVGIRNGIDPNIWDPQEDSVLSSGYNANTHFVGKANAKRLLRRRFRLHDPSLSNDTSLNLQNDKPLVIVISRLTMQKGIHLIEAALYRTLEMGGQFILLGSAPDATIQQKFDNLQRTMTDASTEENDVGFCFDFNESLSHLLYAGGDIVVVPSMFEPCGLTQMIAMRYGTIPVVRATGGLRDTVYDIDREASIAERKGTTPNGFTFTGTDEQSLFEALDRCISLYYLCARHDGPSLDDSNGQIICGRAQNTNRWHRLVKTVMQQDWTWNGPAHQYIEMYFDVLTNTDF